MTIDPPLSTSPLTEKTDKVDPLFVSYQWAKWFEGVFRKLHKRAFSINLYMTAALSPSIDPMADGLIGLAPVALADDTKDESRNSSFHVPINWVEGTDISVHIHFVNNSAQTGTNSVVTELTYLPMAEHENTIAAGTTLSSTYALPNNSVAGVFHDGPAFVIPGSSLSLGDVVFIKILRKGSDAADTVTGDMGYDGIHIKYTGYINHE